MWAGAVLLDVLHTSRTFFLELAEELVMSDVVGDVVGGVVGGVVDTVPSAVVSEGVGASVSASGVEVSASAEGGAVEPVVGRQGRKGRTVFVGEDGAAALRDVFERRADGQKYREIAEAHGVSYSYVSYILSGQMLAERTEGLRAEFADRLPARRKRKAKVVPASPASPGVESEGGLAASV